MIGRVFNSNFNFIHLSLIANTGALSEYSTIEETIFLKYWKTLLIGLTVYIIKI